MFSSKRAIGTFCVTNLFYIISHVYVFEIYFKFSSEALVLISVLSTFIVLLIGLSLYGSDGALFCTSPATTGRSPFCSTTSNVPLCTSKTNIPLLATISISSPGRMNNLDYRFDLIVHKKHHQHST